MHLLFSTKRKLYNYSKSHHTTVTSMLVQSSKLYHRTRLAFKPSNGKNNVNACSHLFVMLKGLKSKCQFHLSTINQN